MKRFLLIALFFASSLLGMMGRHQAIVEGYTMPQSQQQIRQRLYDFLDSAENLILVAVYTFNDREIARHLAQLHASGKNVQVIIDPDSLQLIGGANVYDILQDAGIQVLLRRTHERSLMHHKFVVVDNQKVWTGSSNFDAPAFNDIPPNSDENIVIIESPQIAQLFSRAFRALKNLAPIRGVVSRARSSSESSDSLGSSLSRSSSSELTSDEEGGFLPRSRAQDLTPLGIENHETISS